MTTPTTSPGVCAIWTTSAAVTGSFPDIQTAITAGTLTAAAVDLACAQASDILFSLSGRQFQGVCERTFRPSARPITWTTADWARYFEQLTGNFYAASWGTCMGGAHDLCRQPPQVDLGVSLLRAVNLVKIDGTVIPSTEYRIDEGRWLVRTRPNVNFQPTARWGWPICQDLSLPDSEPGTFSVDAMYGMDPPSSGVAAAEALAAELARAHANIPNRLPTRLTSITRQGVTMAVVDPMQYLDKGLTGVYEADVFIRAYNPDGQRRRPKVYSPDLGYTRAQG